MMVHLDSSDIKKVTHHYIDAPDRWIGIYRDHYNNLIGLTYCHAVTYHEFVTKHFQPVPALTEFYKVSCGLFTESRETQSEIDYINNVIDAWIMVQSIQEDYSTEVATFQVISKDDEDYKNDNE